MPLYRPVLLIGIIGLADDICIAIKPSVRLGMMLIVGLVFFLLEPEFLPNRLLEVLDVKNDWGIFALIAASCLLLVGFVVLPISQTELMGCLLDCALCFSGCPGSSKAMDGHFISSYSVMLLADQCSHWTDYARYPEHTLWGLWLSLLVSTYSMNRMSVLFPCEFALLSLCGVVKSRVVRREGQSHYLLITHTCTTYPIQS